MPEGTLSRDQSDLPKTLDIWAARRFVVGRDCDQGKAPYSCKRGDKLTVPYIVGRRLLSNHRAVDAEIKVPKEKKPKAEASGKS